MKKIISFFSDRNFMSVFGTISGTVIYCLGVVLLLDLGGFYAGGITGISQLFDTFTGLGIKSILIPILNAPLFLIAWKSVSRRFAILSLVSVLLQFAIIAVLEYLFVPVTDETGKIITESIINNPFKDDSVSRLFLAIFGGLVTGAGCAICLKYGGSTGGLDIISQYMSLVKHINFTKFSFIVDLIIILTATVFDEPLAGAYTIIRHIISILTYDKIHTTYNYGKISIVTEEKQRMRDALIKRFNHGITIYQATGGFSNKPKYVLESTLWSFEHSDYVRLAKEVDPNCFITYSAIKKVDGTFNIKTIA